MAVERLGRAVLELVTDSAGFFADVKDIKREASEAIPAAFRRTRGSLDDVSAGLTTVGATSRTTGTHLTGMATSGEKGLGRLKDATGGSIVSMQSLKSVIGQVASGLGLAFGVTAAVGGVVAFTKGIGEFAGKMTDLSAETQLSTTRLQAFNYLGTGVGLTIDQLTTSANQLAKRLGGGDQSVTDALEKLNLKGADLEKLGLDEIMFQIDERLKGVGNQFERARVLADLFGRSGAQLGRIMDGSLREAITGIEKTGAIIDEELIKKADAFDDAWQQGWVSFRAFAVETIAAVATALGQLKPPGFLQPGAFGQPGAPTKPRPIPSTHPSQPQPLQIDMTGLGPQFAMKNGELVWKMPEVKLPPGFKQLQVDMGGLGPQLKVVGDGLVAAGTGAKSYVAELAALDLQIKKLTPTQRAEIDAALAANVAHDKIAKTLDLATPVIDRYVDQKKDLTKATKDEAKAAKEAEDAWKPYIDLLDRIGEAEVKQREMFKQMGTDMLWMLRNRRSDALIGQQLPIAALMGGPGAVSDKGGAEGWLAGIQGQLTKAIGSIGSSLTRAFEGVPNLILSAFTGGGGVKGAGLAAAGLFGSSLLGKDTNLTKSITSGLGNILPKSIGNAIGAMLPGLGSLIGPAISGLGKLFGKLFGSEGKETNRLRDQTLAQFTGITGTKFEQQAAFREMALEAGIAAREVDRLFSTGKVKDFEAQFGKMTDRIRAFTNEQEADQQRLTAAVEKYGFTFEELGTKFQQNRLDDQAKELIEDWRVLVGAGVDVEVVNTRMSDAINEYLQTAVRVGAEVPAALRPILEQMAAQGQLRRELNAEETEQLEASKARIAELEELIKESQSTEETEALNAELAMQKQKVDELTKPYKTLEEAGVKFAETMTEGFDRVVEKLNELIRGLQTAGRLAADLPTNPGAGIIDPTADYAPVPMLGAGGLVTRPLLAGIGESGPEAVVPLDRLAALLAPTAAVESGLATVNETLVALRRDFRTLPNQLLAAALARG